MTLVTFILCAIGFFAIIAMMAYSGYLPTSAFGRVDAPQWTWRGLLIDWPGGSHEEDDDTKLPRRLLYRDFDKSGRNIVFYEAANLLQRPLVLLIWHLRMWRAKAEGRLFVVPGQDGCTTSGDSYRWMGLHSDMSTIEHLLRVRHNHWRHDMDNDAIAIEFATSADHDEFRRQAAATGPSTFNFRDHLRPDTGVQFDMLMARNRALTAMEKPPLWRRALDGLGSI